MGTLSPSVVLTLPSAAPADDATYLEKLFFHKKLLRSSVQDDDNDSAAAAAVSGGHQVLEGDGIMIVLVRAVVEISSASLVPIATWAVEPDEIMATEGRNGGSKSSSSILLKMGTFLISEIRLPGGAAIVMVPFGLLASGEGRRALTTRLVILSSSSSSSTLSNERIKPRNGTEGVIADAIDDDDNNNNNIYQRTEDAALNSIGDEISLQPAVESSTAAANPLPNFSSLSVKLLEKDGKRRPFPLNSREPVQFETDLFQGKILVVARPLNPETDDPYWNERIFAAKKRRLVINIQGRFKREPRGVVYAGAEISDPMKLGLVTRGLCKVLLRLVESFNKNLHYSFGGDGNGNGAEVPHIVAPAYTFFERLAVTPPGVTPPSMDECFDESPESISYRKKTALFGEWNTTDTYSFSFYSMYIDLPTWQLVGLPASGDISLKTFWGQSLLRICMYEKTGNSKQHLQDANRYAFSVQMKFLGKHGRTEEDDESLSDDDDENIIAWSERQRRSSIVQQTKADDFDRMNRSDSQLFPDYSYSEQSDDDDLLFFDAEESHSEDAGISPTPDKLEAPELPISTLPLSTAQRLGEIDAICPFWIDMFVNYRGGAIYVNAFAINTGSRTTFRLEQACEDLLLHSSPMDEVDRTIMNNFSPRMSRSEQLRRSIGLTLSRASDEDVKAFRDQPSKLDANFLRRARPSLASTRTSGFVARAVSDRHWVEEWACINDRHISFHHPEKRKADFLLPLSNISTVERLSPDRGPQVIGYHILVLTTLGRSVYLMFASESEIDAWQQVIDSHRAARPQDAESVSSCDTNALRLVEIDSATDEFLHKSSMWNCKNRRILNCAKFYFRQEASEAATSLNPLSLAENALEKAVTMSTEGLENAEQRRAFLDSAAELKRASIHGLDEASRVAFYLNVYHTMISHAFLVLGAPDSSLKWISYFNNIAYQVGDDIFSLTELEHCIIRAKMSYPTQFFSRFVIPKSTYSMALTSADYRINFALNCGSLSNPSKILLYKPDQLQEQLDEASRMYLKNSVTYRRSGSGDLELKLPKICQWFADDFGSSRENLLNHVERFLPDDVRRQLAGCRLPREGRFDMSSCTIRYHSFNFECTPLFL